MPTLRNNFIAITIPLHALNNALSSKVSKPQSQRQQRETPAIEPMFDSRKEAQLIQLACSPPPEGHCAWTLQLLADKCVELNIVEKTSVIIPSIVS